MSVLRLVCLFVVCIRFVFNIIQQHLFRNIIEKCSLSCCLFLICLQFILNVSIVVIAEMTIYLDETSQRHESVLIAYAKRIGQLISSPFKLLSLRQQRSIAALFVCENHNDLKNLEHLYLSLIHI